MNPTCGFALFVCYYVTRKFTRTNPHPRTRSVNELPLRCTNLNCPDVARRTPTEPPTDGLTRWTRLNSEYWLVCLVVFLLGNGRHLQKTVRFGSTTRTVDCGLADLAVRLYSLLAECTSFLGMPACLPNWCRHCRLRHQLANWHPSYPKKTIATIGARSNKKSIIVLTKNSTPN